MAWKMNYEFILIGLGFLYVTNAFDDSLLIPSDASQIDNWFQQNVFTSPAGPNLDPALIAAESNVTIIKVRKDGSGDVLTVTDAINKIPVGNTKRVIVWIGGGTYNEKPRINRDKPFITLYGSPDDRPTIIFGGTSSQYGTVESASVIAESEYFVASNIIFSNSARRPFSGERGQQAVAMRITGDKAAFYNCRFHGFQDTLCDDKGRHFFKDCYIEGTVDFIFGNAQSIYLKSEIHVIPEDDKMAVITAHARKSDAEPTGYIFLHCNVTGTSNVTYLGRAWFPYSKVIFAYTYMSGAVHPSGWSNNYQKQSEKTVYYGEYKGTGPGSDMTSRVGFTKHLSDAEISPYMKLNFLEASKWLLPPPAEDKLSSYTEAKDVEL
ncbi:putative pectinesterase 63 [Impatiens glandulifera]|uniref:putative pectinesterase 63 n=1 Tax=Impatiens glandulifera TaxID=253017 RepID=UPI001FB10245|nr:putative pectinesterase 63 [Impatiens glandulifera]